jgi:hypothetical protein
MVPFSMLATALATTAGDQTAAYLLIGGFIVFLIVIASSQTKRKVKRFCPYCSKKINYSVSENGRGEEYDLAHRG